MNIIGIGVDIVDISRIEKAAASKRFLSRCFSENELKEFENKSITFLAGRFAGKEAVSKTFGTGIRGFGMNEIEILDEESGRPVVYLYKNAKKTAESLGINSIHISISHDNGAAVAFAVAEN